MSSEEHDQLEKDLDSHRSHLQMQAQHAQMGGGGGYGLDWDVPEEDWKELKGRAVVDE